jgi:RNA polymerase sigma-70 factor (ECF subfamily)
MMDVSQAFEAEIPRLRRHALKLTRDAGATDDLVQETLLRGLDKLHLWEEGTNLGAWLQTILHNQFVNQIRRARREGIVVELSDVEEPLSRPPTQETGLELRDVQRALNKLPEGQRDTVLLIGLGGLRYSHAARVTGAPIGTVRSRLSRGREKLRTAASGSVVRHCDQVDRRGSGGAIGSRTPQGRYLALRRVAEQPPPIEILQELAGPAVS